LLAISYYYYYFNISERSTEARLIVEPYAQGFFQLTHTHVGKRTHTFFSLSVPMDSVLFICTNDEEKRRRNSTERSKIRKHPRNVLFVTLFS
jgi:hypothetical protein